jgi:Cys-rich repeat protein
MTRRGLTIACGITLLLPSAASCNFDTRPVRLAGVESGDASALSDGIVERTQAPRLEVEPTSLDLSRAVVGLPSRGRLALVNAGDAPLADPSVSLLFGSDPDFIILHDQCENTLGPGDRCDVRVQLLPSKPGPSSALMGADSSGQNVQAPITGVGFDSGPLTLAPVSGFSVNFGGAVLGQSVESQFVLSNPAAVSSGLLRFTSNDAQIQVLPPIAGDCQASATALANGQSCRIRVAFTPIRRGAMDSTLVVSSENQGSTSLLLSGHGKLPPTLAAPQAVEFGGVARGFTGLRTLQVQNLGDEPLELSAIELAGPTTTSEADDSAFYLQTSDCAAGDVLASRARCSMTVGFRPLTAAAEQRSVQITASGGAQHVVMLRGTGLDEGALLVSAPGGSNDFGALSVGQSATQTYLVTNPSAQPSGPIELRTYDDFSLMPRSTEGDCEGGVTSLVNGQSCAVTISFTPSDRGQHDGALTISSTLAAATHLALVGQGLAVAKLTATRTEVDFGRVITESRVQQSLQVINTGDEPASGVTARIEAPDGGPAVGFSLQNSCAGEVSAIAPCIVALEFSPTKAASYSAVLRLTSDTGGTTSALLLGSAFAPGSLLLAVAGSSNEFGDVAVDAPRTIDFTLTNSGNVASGRLTITTSNPVFLVNEAGCGLDSGTGLPPGGTCTFSVTFDPETSETVTANLSIQSPGAGETATPLTGRGRLPSKLNATGTRDLGVANVDDASMADSGNQFTWTVNNEGDVGSGLLQVANDNSAEFVVSNDTCSNVGIPAAGSCAMDIRFRPSVAGPRTAQLVVTDASTMQVVQLVVTGTGVVIAQPGEPCLNGVRCASGVCTGGVCCDRACEGSCQVCNSAGVCADQAERQACGNGIGQCFGVNQCLLPELTACSGNEQCGSQNCELRLDGQTPNDQICCLEDCGNTGQQCNPQTGRCELPTVGQGASCGAAGQPACAVGLECKACPGGGNQCTPADQCCGDCASGYQCIDGDRCGCALGSNGLPQLDCGGGQCILDRERACCPGMPSCPPGFPVCNGAAGLCVQCLVNADCGPCSICSGNACQPLARGQQGSCAAGQLCNGSGACLLPECTGAGQCGDCNTCTDFTCIRANQGASCSQNRVCTATAVCVQCIDDRQCSSGQRCNSTNNTCVAACSANETLIDGVCVPNAPTVDCSNSGSTCGRVPCGPTNDITSIGCPVIDGGGCCYTAPEFPRTTTCVPPGATCGGSFVTCNSREDCPTGQVCCGSGSGDLLGEWSVSCVPEGECAPAGSPAVGAFNREVCDPAVAPLDCGTCDFQSFFEATIFECL